MQHYRGIVSIYRWPDSLYMIPNFPNTLTRQYSGTNDVWRDPLRGPITCNTDRFTDTLRLHLLLQSRNLHRHHNCHDRITAFWYHSLLHLICYHKALHWQMEVLFITIFKTLWLTIPALIGLNFFLID